MNATIYFSLCSLFYCIMLLFIVFGKKREEYENKILKVLIICNFVSLLLEVAGMFLGGIYKQFELLNAIVLRSMLVFHVVWASLFVLFVLSISKEKDSFKDKKKYPFYGLILITSILVSVLPIIYNTKNGVIVYTSGTAVDLVYAYSLLCEIICLFVMFKNIKKIKATKYVSLFALVSLGTLVFTIQSTYPELLLSTSMQPFVTYLVYFTINKYERIKK